MVSQGKNEFSTQNEFYVRSEKLLKRLETGLQDALDSAGVDADVDTVADGVLEIQFASGTKIIVNRHTPAEEIWIAAKSGGFHFRFADGDWSDTRDGTSFIERLKQLLNAETGESLTLSFF